MYINKLKAIRILHTLEKKSDLSTAEKLIKCFSDSYPKLYGISNLTYTFHCVSKHLVDDVRKHGSLCCHSMFSAESCLGFVNSAMHGTRGFAHQYIKCNKNQF